MPAEMTTMSTFSSLPSANARPSTLPLPKNSSVLLPRCTRTFSSLDFLEQRLRARLVDLARHQPRGVLDDVGLEPEVQDRLRGLEAEQAAADHRGRTTTCPA